jgi:hypothetical protein
LHFSFHAVRALSEKLAEGKEYTYPNWCFDWTPNTMNKVFSIVFFNLTGNIEAI